MLQQPPVRIQRKLSAILAADVADYSRFMHSDEEATHLKLTTLLAEAVETAIAEWCPYCEEHRRRIPSAVSKRGASSPGCSAVPGPHHGSYDS